MSFNVTTNEIDPIIAGAPDCPNPQWTEAINDLLFTSADITVVQGGSTVFSVACTFTSNTSNGAGAGRHRELPRVLTQEQTWVRSTRAHPRLVPVTARQNGSAADAARDARRRGSERRMHLI